MPFPIVKLQRVWCSGLSARYANHVKFYVQPSFQLWRVPLCITCIDTDYITLNSFLQKMMIITLSTYPKDVCIMFLEVYLPIPDMSVNDVSQIPVPLLHLVPLTGSKSSDHRIKLISTYSSSEECTVCNGKANPCAKASNIIPSIKM